MTHASSAPPSPADRVTLDGHIAGVGTQEGTRFVVGRWLSSPLGAFADVMVERADGTRVLLAPSDDVAALVTRLYTFDAVHVVDVRVAADRAARTWTVEAGPLDARIEIGPRTPIGHLLHGLPRAVTRAGATAGVVAAVAGVVLPGVRTRGTGDDGTPERYAAHDQHAVVGVDARWGDRLLGALRPVEPAVRFGFSSVPAQPAVTAVHVVIG
ncbi:hypothetical protein [Cellulomonas shaoxiangyii]|uniref:Uncharacterized protein n=1 Tax=Cellulomonas shaoxiangyii TaxID=2566013 RepID=A0A4P7SIR2_9CELL|nr:hypothetical protein [Cellulomonas shaoxiangyii]QCB93661.1 hypothetical protein E5225_08875 [Cellulomonas shaoxiangyii]TGY86142.1 hypothetical protein E5226_03175 [Cellulomonas shaoxiangyii]